MKNKIEDEEWLVDVQNEVKREFEVAFNYPTRKDWEGSDVAPAFDADGNFISDNWCDARISLFRWFFGGMFTCGPIYNEVRLIGGLAVAHFYLDDRNYVFIHDYQSNSTYHCSWYKSRGRTDLFTKNGSNISLSEFKELILLLLKPELEFFE